MTIPLAELLGHFSVSERLPPPELERRQMVQLRRLLQHFNQQSPWFAARLQHCGLTVDEVTGSYAAFRAFPLTSRKDIQAAGESFGATEVPKTHAPVVTHKSSGSTGEPVSVRRTALNHLFWRGATVRDHLWHARDAQGTLAAVRANLTHPTKANAWGPPVSEMFATGPAYGIPSSTDITAMIDLLREAQPDYLLVYPSILMAILNDWPGIRDDLRSLRQIRTIGETVSDELRQRTLQQTGTPLVDIYSAEEVGTVAIQCPQGELYHTMAEYLRVEVLRPDGTPCSAGEVGRVVVTDLYNYASPIIRYENGDYAEVGDRCACGRSLPTLRRILGRERNMVKLPDGRRYWPTTGFREFSTVADVRQYQFVQTSLHGIEVRLVGARGPLNPSEEHALGQVISRWIGHAFDYRFVYFEGQIPRQKSGKFEEFVCEI